ncbi:MAG: cytochrome c biogenesis protein CcsA, partial [Rikenellaceae bacterium]
NDEQKIVEKAIYGALIKNKFSHLFDISGKPLLVQYRSFMGSDAAGLLNIEVFYDGESQKLSVEGGKYQHQPAMVVNIKGVEVQVSYGSNLISLPFSVELIDFTLERYPGSSSPSSYSSSVVIDYNGKREKTKIFMNNIAYTGSYRIYQTSYDKDEKGTILTINKDLTGTIISYLGYLLLTIGLIASIFHKGSRMNYLRRRLKEISTMSVLLLLTFTTVAASAADQQSTERIRRSIAPTELSADMSKLLIQNPNGRIEPMGSYALKILRKLHRSSDFLGMSPTQVMIGLITNQAQWSTAALLYVSNDQLLKEIGVHSGSYIAYADLFDQNGNYILEEKVNTIYAKSQSEQNKYEKEILKLDEKINILYALFQGKMLPMFPIKDHPQSKWISMGDDLTVFTDNRDSLLASKIIPWLAMEISKKDYKKAGEIIEMIKIFQQSKADSEHLISDKKINAELFYNSINIFKQSSIAYLAFGTILLAVMLTMLMNNRGIKSHFIIKFLCTGLIVAFLWHSFGVALRWYISGRAPWTNSYESMVYVAWSALLTGIIFIRRSPVTLAISAIMAGAVIMISQLNLLDPEITPLVPVLKSYWLMFHVASITASYGFFGVGALLGIAVMIIFAISPKDKFKTKIEELSIINEMALTIGLILLTIGIFIGAVWANESWGRYWGWDPKESWALITMIIYAFVLHARFIKSLRGKFIFNAMSIYAFYTVLMTFFGVNYYLSGMHSYGQV